MIKITLTILFMFASSAFAKKLELRLTSYNGLSEARKVLAVSDLQKIEKLFAGKANCEFDFTLVQSEFNKKSSHVAIALHLTTNLGYNSSFGEVPFNEGLFHILADDYVCSVSIN